MTPVRGLTIGHTDIDGDLGRRVVARLSEHGVTATPDFRGMRTVFVVPVRERPDRAAVHAATVDAAVAAGAEHLVYLSFVHTSATATFTLSRDHFATEQHIRRSGAAFTFVRASAFHEVAHYLVGPDDVIRGPAGSGRVAFVGKNDVADVLSAVLMNPSAHRDAAYELTGPTAFSLAELAQLFSDHTGRRISYVDETVADAYASRAGFGAPPWQLDAWVSTYLQIATGELGSVTSDVERLLGRPAESFETYLARHPQLLTSTS
jgi:uncharacterized protein YbjT (DUF2867 family)